MSQVYVLENSEEQSVWLTRYVVSTWFIMILHLAFSVTLSNKITTYIHKPCTFSCLYKHQSGTQKLKLLNWVLTVYIKLIHVQPKTHV